MNANKLVILLLFILGLVLMVLSFSMDCGVGRAFFVWGFLISAMVGLFQIIEYWKSK